MKCSTRIFALVTLFLFFAAFMASAENTGPATMTPSSPECAYHIGAGDIVDIKIWRHSELDTKTMVRPDGNIFMPLVGDIAVADKSPSDLAILIRNGLEKTLKYPKVSVNIAEFGSKKIFVLGEVNLPGVFSFDSDITVVEAITRAGGYKDPTACMSSVILIKNADTKTPHAIRLNIWDVLNKGKTKDNVLLAAGDIVFVPKTFIAKLDTFIDQFITKTDPILQYYLDILSIKKGRRYW